MPERFDLEAFLPYRLSRAAEAASVAFAREYRRLYGMSRADWRTLAALGQQGTLSATQIGRHSAMHKTKVSRAVARLEARRWLTRRSDEHDRRIEHLALTKAGLSAYATLTGRARIYQDALARELGQERLDGLMQALDAIDASQGGG